MHNRTEEEALEAKIAANQAAAQARELATENRILETELAAERDASASNQMGLVLVLGLILAALVIGGFMWWGRVDRDKSAVYAETRTGRTVVVRPASR